MAGMSHLFSFLSPDRQHPDGLIPHVPIILDNSRWGYASHDSILPAQFQQTMPGSRWLSYTPDMTVEDQVTDFLPPTAPATASTSSRLRLRPSPTRLSSTRPATTSRLPSPTSARPTSTFTARTSQPGSLAATPPSATAPSPRGGTTSGRRRRTSMSWALGRSRTTGPQLTARLSTVRWVLSRVQQVVGTGVRSSVQCRYKA